MVPKLYTIAKDEHTKVNRRRVLKLHISAEAYTMDHEGYTMDYKGYTMDYDGHTMSKRRRVQLTMHLNYMSKASRVLNCLINIEYILYCTFNFWLNHKTEDRVLEG